MTPGKQSGAILGLEVKEGVDADAKKKADDKRTDPSHGAYLVRMDGRA